MVKQSYTEFDPNKYNTLNYLPKISIVVPSYNQDVYLEKCLNSIICQNYPNLELIVIDGGSTDKSVEIIKKHAQYIHYWISEKDNGQANAINKGFKLASGDLFGWLNSDDCYNFGVFYYLVYAYNKYPKSNFFYGDALNIDPEDNITQYWSANFLYDRYLRFGGIVASHSAFWKKTIHQPLDENLNCNVDGELWIRLIKGSKKQYISKPLGSYRDQPQSKSSAEKWIKKWKEDDEYIMKKHGPPPAPRSMRSLEYRFINKFKFIKRLILSKTYY